MYSIAFFQRALSAFARSSVKILLIVSSSLASAAVPLPPLVCQSADSCGTPYDLSRYDIPFEVNWPAPPETDRTIRVPAEMSLNAASEIAGAHIIVSAGIYPGFRIDQRDQWYEFLDGARIQGDVTIDDNFQERTRITGGHWSNGHFYIFGGRDILIEDMYRDTSSTTHEFYGGFVGESQSWTVPRGTHRLAIINSTYRGRSYFGFFQNGLPYNGDFHQDVIIANCDLEISDTVNSLVRLMDVTRSVVVDSRLASTGHHTYRVHYSSSDNYFAGNQVEGAGAMFGVNPGSVVDGQMGSLYFVDNAWYRNVQNSLIDRGGKGGYPDIQQLVITGNQIFDNFGGLGTREDGPQDIVRNNVEAPYISPPAFDAGVVP